MVPEAFASNIDGTTTLIGDPPNILIGSYPNLSFGDFVISLLLICAICLLITVSYFIWWHKKNYQQADVRDVSHIADYLREYRITDHKLMIMGLITLSLTIFLFVVHGVLHLEPSVIGAMVILAIPRVNIVEKILEQEVEWPTLVFHSAFYSYFCG